MRPRLTLAFLLLCSLTLFSGCDINLNMAKDGADTVASKAPAVGAVASDALTALEEATGKDILTAPTAAKLEGIANKIDSLAIAAKTGAGVIAPFVPAAQKPIADAATAGLAALAAVAAAAAELFRRQKNQAVKTAVEIADSVPGLGKQAAVIAASNGIAPAVKTEYNKQAALGLAGKSATSS